MSKIFVRRGNATVDVSPALERLVNRLLDANPIIKKAMMDSIEDIYQDAYKRWPVRHISPRTAAQKKKATYEAIKRSRGKSDEEVKAIIGALDKQGRFEDDPEPRISPRSKDSKNKLERGILIESGELIGFIRNKAPYAFAIRTGEHTLNNLAFGTRTVSELISKPMRKAGNKVANQLAKEMLKQAKKK